MRDFLIDNRWWIAGYLVTGMIHFDNWIARDGYKRASVRVGPGYRFCVAVAAILLWFPLMLTVKLFSKR